MIFDILEACITYLESNMKDITCNQRVIPIYRDIFPEDAPNTAISVNLELTQSTEWEKIEDGALRLICRAEKNETAFILMQNTDLLIDKIVRRNLDDKTELVLGRRNAGPNQVMADKLFIQTSFYTCTFRRTV